MDVVEMKVNSGKLEGWCREEIRDQIRTLDLDLVWWDTKELTRRTCLSFPTIKEHFFYHPDFPKKQVGQKWMYPAEETRSFLLNWLNQKGE